MKRKHFESKARIAQESGDKYRKLSMAYALGAVRESHFPVPTVPTESEHERKLAKAARKAALKQRKDRKNQSRRQRAKHAYVNYEQYIRSDEWFAFRKIIFGKRGRRCEQCQRTDGEMNLHHLTYERLGHEKRGDVKILCRPCHEAFHQICKVQ